MKTYQPENFNIRELVSKRFYNIWGHQSMWFLDQMVLVDVDFIRNDLDRSITINDWQWDGNYNESGLRTKGDEYYSPTSAHAFGKAFDLKVEGMSSFEVQDYIKKISSKDKLKGINRLEVGTDGWTHVDGFNAKPNDEKSGLYLFRP